MVLTQDSASAEHFLAAQLHVFDGSSIMSLHDSFHWEIAWTSFIHQSRLFSKILVVFVPDHKAQKKLSLYHEKGAPLVAAELLVDYYLVVDY